MFPFMQNIPGIKIPVFAPEINILPVNIQTLFGQAFISGHTSPYVRPKPQEWRVALNGLRQNLKNCNKVTHHQYNNNLSGCPWCKADKAYNDLINKSYTPPQQTRLKQTPIRPPITQTITRPSTKTKTKKGIPKPTIVAVVAVIAIAIFFIARNAQISPPQNVRLGTQGTTEVTIQWDNSGTDISYNLYWNTRNDPSSARILGNPSRGTSTNVTGLTSGTTYHFWVVAVRNGRESPKSNSVTFTARDHIVNSVTISPSTATVQRGQTRQFSATVTGTGNPPQNVTWTVTGGSNGTSISNTGLLRIAANDNATNLTVRATSTADNRRSATATVTVSAASAASQNPLVGTTWEFIDRNDNDRRYRLVYTQNNVTFTVFNRDGSVFSPAITGTYTLQGTNLTKNFDGYIDRYVFEQSRIVSSANRSMVYTRR